jgi:UDPglucose 6-dehydrogenase
MGNRSAEVTKYAANCMLASRISFMNEIAGLCERVGADIQLVQQGIGTDRRIGPTFLFAGIGYGGSCFPKDIRALIHLGQQLDYPIELITAVERVNERQKEILVQKVLSHFCPADSPATLKGLRLAIWGLSFKPRTDDMREAPSLPILSRLLELGAELCVHDPAATESARSVFGDRIEYASNNYESLEGAQALLLLTEWNAYRNPDFPRMKSLLKEPIIFDGRNVYNPKEMKDLGFIYYGIGRGESVGTIRPPEARS